MDDFETYLEARMREGLILILEALYVPGFTPAERTQHIVETCDEALGGPEYRQMIAALYAPDAKEESAA